MFQKQYMKKLYLLLIITFLINHYTIAQNYSRIWVSLNQDFAAQFLNLNDMAVDATGNSYLSGYEQDPGDQYFEKHFVLFKINAAGNLQWKRNFTNIKDSIDEAIAVITDSLGYVYITGKRIDTFCNICTYSTKISDIITMKYDSNGNRLWLNRYHDSDFILAAPADIALSANGTIVITGNESKYNSQTGTYESKMLLQKINNNGKTLWLKKMDNVVGNSACFDNRNNIVVVGSSNPDNIYQTQKPITLKFSPSGNLLWSTIYTEANKNGHLYFVQCDASNNIYTNGQTDTITFYNNPKIITIKYSGSGTQQWFRKEAGNTTTLPHFYGNFKADAAGNCYLTGYISKSGSDDDWLTVKYNKAGVKKWSNLFDDVYHGSDKPIGIAIDKKGYTHVAGYVYGTNGNYSIATVHYNKTGALLDSDIYKRGNNSNGFATGIGVDKNDNVYTGGGIGIYNNPYPSFVVIKYALQQNLALNEVNKTVVAGNFKIFPNPVTNILNIQFTTTMPAGNYKLLFNDINGNTVLLKPININNKTVNFAADVQHLKQGVYTAVISDGFNSISQTFIKE